MLSTSDLGYTIFFQNLAASLLWRHLGLICHPKLIDVVCETQELAIEDHDSEDETDPRSTAHYHKYGYVQSPSWIGNDGLILPPGADVLKYRILIDDKIYTDHNGEVTEVSSHFLIL